MVACSRVLSSLVARDTGFHPDIFQQPMWYRYRAPDAKRCTRHKYKFVSRASRRGFAVYDAPSLLRRCQGCVRRCRFSSDLEIRIERPKRQQHAIGPAKANLSRIFATAAAVTAWIHNIVFLNQLRLLLVDGDVTGNPPRRDLFGKFGKPVVTQAPQPRSTVTVPSRSARPIAGRCSPGSLPGHQFPTASF